MASLNGPVFLPAAPNPIVPRDGLFKVATGPLDLPRNARIGGLEYEISHCALPSPYEIECQDSHNTKVIESGITTVSGGPFVVYSAIRCSTVGLVNWGHERVNKFLYDQLVAGEQAVVERTFSTSGSGLFPGLSGNPAVVDLGTAPNGIVRATGMLEDWLYSRYGLIGTIHSPMLAAPYFYGAHLVYKDSSGICRTDVGTMLSFGNYAGTGPTGQVPATGDTWLYITGQVAIFRTPDSDLFVPTMGEVINRSSNALTIVMEREYVLTYDCYVAAVQVHLDTTDH
jgi:hypothetical protein